MTAEKKKVAILTLSQQWRLMAASLTKELQYSPNTMD